MRRRTRRPGVSAPGGTVAPATAPAPSRFEVVALCVLIFVLPLFEVPKHLAWVGWVAAWIAARGPGAVVRPRWTAWDWTIGAFVASALAAGAFSGDWRSSLAESGDAVRIAITAWLVGRGGYSPRQLAAALAAALAGTLAALVWAAIALTRKGPPEPLELNSVGHVNHSAIYLVIALSVAAGLALAAWRCRLRGAGALVFAGLLILLALLVGASRAALGAAAVFLALLAVAGPAGVIAPGGASAPSSAPSAARLRLLLLAAVGGAIALYAALVHLSPRPLQPAGEGVAEKFVSRPQESGPLSFRDRIWRVAWMAFEAQPLAGVGNDRFRALTPQALCPAGSDASRCDPQRLQFTTHAHSVYMNTLAERGAFGAAALLALIAAWLSLLRRTRTAGASASWAAAVWWASAGGLCVTALAGLLNTTLHHEHGMLAMFTLGALRALDTARRPG
jgi:O-antigen ligase